MFRTVTVTAIILNLIAYTEARKGGGMLSALSYIISILCNLISLFGLGGFLFLCFGDCEPWQYVLMAISIIFTVSCCCCYACFKAKSEQVETGIHSLAQERQLAEQRRIVLMADLIADGKTEEALRA